MSISSVGTNSYQGVSSLTSTLANAGTTLSTVNNADVNTINSTAAASGNTSQTAATSANGFNSSSLAAALQLSLSQFNAGSSISALFGSSDSSQQSSSDFLSNLLGSLPGLSSSTTSSSSSLTDLLNGSNGSGSSASQTPAVVQLDSTSATFKLQTSIQNLITQLDNGSSASSSGDLFGASGSGSSSSLQSLQQSFNDLITSSGGNPSQTSLQSFLKVVAANVQGSASIGSLFDASA
ncbi:hypothetical protein QN372_19190 [Undibacterium sp. RTI2.1]|uniref:hypothetical protein n=1 Tax=unclassified Undibacterium TaxID=2630295 RepID=UPI002AB45D87|nr:MULTISPECIES: hypothetical protein [unclassified Undibacterium]MDY7538100.1 hypothetical protein [Undibacterium sp. 5I1]MEB0032878.1 hypothetical protein [Undibacterium sp. RTI2.1]MEB0118690.1 hypothetical protein [Undibacterium sp. RTI2.2]MEB0232568.1 hypothetical protein [Undibacterium sp. 10I3]MEB0259613.1 hypothetical protein [Undibacterium sp. 5I1]